MLSGSGGGSVRRIAVVRTMFVVDVTLLYFDDCPNWRLASTLVDRLAAEHEDVVVHRRVVDSEEEAQRVGFIGSPTILIDGVDPWAPDGASFGLSCRIFVTPEGPTGSPTWEQLEAAVAARRA